jgi:hypothetical protein
VNVTYLSRSIDRINLHSEPENPQPSLGFKQKCLRLVGKVLRNFNLLSQRTIAWGILPIFLPDDIQVLLQCFLVGSSMLPDDIQVLLQCFLVASMLSSCFKTFRMPEFFHTSPADNCSSEFHLYQESSVIIFLSKKILLKLNTATRYRPRQTPWH